MSLLDPHEIESFTKKVEEIERIVRGLSSDDQKTVDENMKKADELLEMKKNDLDPETKTKFGKSRTVINKYDDSAAKSGNDLPQNLSQQAFMEIMERDANERYQRKLESQKLANELKEKGNKEFQNKNYQKAFDFYTEALQKIKDNTAIYTNRAQALIKLEKYDDAISDCNWALRVDEKCIKAMIHKGKALVYLKKFDNALEEFENAKKIDPNQTKIIDEYIKELERFKMTDLQEKAARSFLADDKATGAGSFLDVLKKITESKDQTSLYYSGGLRFLCSMCDDATKRTLFRTQGGFKLFDENQVIKKCLEDWKTVGEMNPDQIDLIVCLLELVHVVCSDCDENIRVLFGHQIIIVVVEKLFLEFSKVESSKNTLHVQILKATLLKTFLKFSGYEFALHQIISNLKTVKLTHNLIKIAVNEKDTGLKEKALLIVQNLVLDSKFQPMLKTDDILTITENICLVLKSSKIDTSIIVNSALTIVYALTSSLTFRHCIINIENTWSLCDEILKNISSDKNPALIEQSLSTTRNVLFCLLTNLSSSKSKNLDNFAEKLTELVLSNVGHLKDSQALSVIGNMIQNVEIKDSILSKIDEKHITALIENIKSNESKSQSVKLMALFAQNSLNLSRHIVSLDKTLKFLYETFKDVSQTHDEPKVENKPNTVNLKKLNESVINNAILCMSKCVENEAPDLATRLTNTNIMMDLLYLARDGHNAEMRKNCGILIAKLVKHDERHLQRLRELHGIEILYASLKNIDI